MILEKYPEAMVYEGVKYKINTDYRIAIECLRITEDDSISDYERSLAIIYLLLNTIPETNLDMILDILIQYLQCGKKPIATNEAKPPIDFDYQHDYQYIVASFLSDYQIDITDGYMHWWKFVTLVDGLGQNCVLSRIRDIRTCDISKYDAKTKSEVLKMRKQVALPIKKNNIEKQMDDEFLSELNLG